MATYFEPPYATTFQRWAAYVADNFIVGFIWYGFFAFGRDGDVAELGQLVSLLLIDFLYYISFMLVFRATPAKLIFGMRISREDGESPEPMTLLLRYEVFLVTNLVFLGPLTSGLYMMNHPDRQAIHDRIAKTVVVRTR